MNCACQDFSVAAEQQFTEGMAASDLESYRSKGPGTTTRLSRDLVKAGPVDGVLLDIGAGVGALTFELLDAGATRAVMVDASRAYLTAASKEAARRGRVDAIQFIHDDFLRAASRIPAADIVTLDRVVCCYPAWKPLLAEALGHSKVRFAFSYPRDRWFVRIWNGLVNGVRLLRRKSFRTYIHTGVAMAQAISDTGFNLITCRDTWTWSVEVHVRTQSKPK